MTLRQTQALFAKLAAQLITWIYAQGWAITFNDASRLDCLGHRPNSTHYIRLALDFNLFVGGDWKDHDCPEWQKIGAYWKSLDPLCRWGGDFTSVDLNHVSLEWNGRA